MRANRGRDTSPEVALRSALHSMGLRFRLHQRIVSDRPRRQVDIVFPGARVAVFVDGCFWHGCPKHGTKAKENARFWRLKVEDNRARDRDTTAQLRRAGWEVVRVWEHEDPTRAAMRIAERVRRASCGRVAPTAMSSLRTTSVKAR